MAVNERSGLWPSKSFFVVAIKCNPSEFVCACLLAILVAFEVKEESNQLERRRGLKETVTVYE